MGGTSKVIVAGIMTGNSLDAVDIATFEAFVDGDTVRSFKQVAFHSEPCSPELQGEIRTLKEVLKTSGGVVDAEVDRVLEQSYRRYHRDVSSALTVARKSLKEDYGLEWDLIGFHGQTIGHSPPSIAAPGSAPYTIQLVDGAWISDDQRIAVVADFRSDDLLNGGEGAPFAPGFNALLTPALGVSTAAFVNAGNTSNIALVRSADLHVEGWDCGPCNQFSDQLMREEQGVFVDENGTMAQSGRVHKELIEALWNGAVVRGDGKNALEITGPRSFDPQWYVLPEPLKSPAICFADRLRSVVAFSAYCVAHSLAVAARNGLCPNLVVLFGGGWKNPVLTQELKNLCRGGVEYLLPQHQQLFDDLASSIVEHNTAIEHSDERGLPSNGMEAGIFAFAALQRILGRPFTLPSFTRCKSPTVCGAVFLPGGVAPVGLNMFAGVQDQRLLFTDRRLGRAALSNQTSRK